MCFIKCINYFTKKDYTEEILTFIRSEQRRSNVMTTARIQPFCRKYNINIGCFDGTRINPQNLTQGDTALKIHENHFCLIWKSDGISFDKEIKELKIISKSLIILYLTNMLKVFLKMITILKVKFPLTNIVVYDLETFNKNRAVSYCSCI